MTKNKDTEFKILKDEPLTKKEADRFGYVDIANNITNLILRIEPPFTIGLYGKWGIGKTSICRLLEENLRENPQYKIFYFDAWKYEKDSFRRQFLIELDNDIFNGELRYRENLNQSLTIPRTSSLKENIKIILDDFLMKVFGIFGGITLILILFKFIILPYIVTGDVLEVSKRFIDLGFFINLFYFLLGSFRLYQGYIQIHRTDSAEGFEYFYKEAIKKLGNKKLLVIIDNLDRLEHKKAIELLSDIKTFLANEKIYREVKNKAIFLIPCDNRSINDHLKEVYGENFDTEEFLRKFFNVSFKVPKLLDLELDDYISEKLKETNIPEFQDNYPLSFVIMNAFRDNPREIIQFINSLITYYSLAKRRRLNYVLDHLPFLAKTLVIRQKWPDVYLDIEEKILRTGLKLEEIVSNIKNDDLKQFLAATNSINVQSQDIFFSLHQSEQERELQEWSSFILSAEEKRFADIKKIYNGIKKLDQINVLNDLLREYIRKNKDKEEKLLNVFISIHQIIDEKNLEEFQVFLNEILDKFTPSLLSRGIDSISFKNIINPSLLRLPKPFITKFTNTIIESLSFTKDDGSPSVSLEKGIEIFGLISQEPIWVFFKIYQSKLTELKNKFIQSIDVNLLLEKISDDENFLEKVLDFIVRVKPANENTAIETIKKINEMLNQPNLQDNRKMIFEYSLRYLQSIDLLKVGGKKEGLEVIQNFSHTIVNLYHQSPDWDYKGLLSKIILCLIPIKENINRNSLISSLRDFISNTDNKEENIIETLTKKELFSLIGSFPEIKEGVIQRSQSNPDLFVEANLKSQFELEELYRILSSLINSDQDQFLRFIKYTSYKIPDTGRDSIATNMINQITILDARMLKEWLQVIKKIGVPSNLLSNFYLNLKNVKNKGEDYSEIVKKFVRRNKRLFGEAQVEDLLKDE